MDPSRPKPVTIISTRSFSSQESSLNSTAPSETKPGARVPGAFASQGTRDGANYLDGWELIRAVVTLNLANGVAFIDLMGVTALLTQVGRDLNAGDSIAWAATSQLVGATLGLSILGYLSDIWSRRKMLMVAQTLLLLSTLGCGLSRYSHSPVFFFVTRAFCGVATGSISNLMNIAQNDILPRERRNKYQGIQGMSIALGSITGMLTGAVLVHRWQDFYFIESGLALGSIAMTYFNVPANCQSPTRDTVWAALKSVDVLGILSGAGFVLPGLTLICQFEDLKDNSPAFVALIVLTGCSFLAFMGLGLMDRGIRPIVPFHLFRNRTIAAILAQNVLFGAAYYSFTYFLPLTIEVVRELSPLRAAVMMVAYFLTHGISSTISALVVNMLQKRKMISYSLVFIFAFAVWTVAMSLLAYQNGAIDAEYVGVVVVLEIMVGIGTGSTFQNSVMAIRSQVTAEHNAVALGTRNVLRFFGGALGTAISSVILRTGLRANLPGRLDYLAMGAFSRPHFSQLSDADAELVQSAYVSATSWIFYTSSILVGICLFLCLFIRDDDGKSYKQGKGASPFDVGTTKAEELQEKDMSVRIDTINVGEFDEKVIDKSGASSRENSVC